MRHFIIALLLSCAACASVQAGDSRPGSATLQDFTGQYILQDGRVLTVTQRQRTLVGQLEGRAPVRLQVAGPATFAAPGRDLVVTFDQHRNGNVVAVTVTETAPAHPPAGQ